MWSFRSKYKTLFDTTVFVRDLDSVTSVPDLLKKFKARSGLEINTTKTEVMWLGRWKEKTGSPFGLDGQTTSFPGLFSAEERVSGK